MSDYPDIDSNTVEILARYIRELFVAYKTFTAPKNKPFKLHGSSWDRKYKQAFFDAAMLCLTDSLLPEDLVLTTFVKLRHHATPKQLTRAAASADVREHRQDLVESERVRMETDVDTFMRIQQVRGYSTRDILSDERMEFTPLFRVCVAAAENLTDVEAVWKPAARLQFAISVEARELFWPLMTSRLKKEFEAYLR